MPELRFPTVIWTIGHHAYQRPTSNRILHVGRNFKCATFAEMYFRNSGDLKRLENIANCAITTHAFSSVQSDDIRFLNTTNQLSIDIRLFDPLVSSFQQFEARVNFT